MKTKRIIEYRCMRVTRYDTGIEMKALHRMLNQDDLGRAAWAKTARRLPVGFIIINGR